MMLDCDPRLSYMPAQDGELATPAWYACELWRTTMRPRPDGTWRIELLVRTPSRPYGRLREAREAANEVEAHRRAQGVLVRLLDYAEAVAAREAEDRTAQAASIEG